MAKVLKAVGEVLTEAQNVADVLTKLKVKLPNGMDGAKLSAKVTSTRGTGTKLADAKRTVGTLVDEQRAEIKDLRKDIRDSRLGIKVIYGEDSAEYQMVGGTRSSEFK